MTRCDEAALVQVLSFDVTGVTLKLWGGDSDSGCCSVSDAEDARRVVARGTDRAKDQSYVLYMLGQRELSRAVFPVGVLTKDAVRAHAARLGLRTAAKPESMEVCFVPRARRVAFLDARSSMRPGPVVDGFGSRESRHAEGKVTDTSTRPVWKLA